MWHIYLEEEEEKILVLQLVFMLYKVRYLLEFTYSPKRKETEKRKGTKKSTRTHNTVKGKKTGGKKNSFHVHVLVK